MESGFEDCKHIVAIGDNSVRFEVQRWLTEQGFDLISAIHPTASIGRGVKHERGTVVMANSVINSDCTIGQGVIVNTKASIDHDCRIDDGVHIAPGATLCGGVSVGKLTLVGAGAVVAPNTSIGSNVTIGAGATVIKDVVDGDCVVGTPATSIW